METSTDAASSRSSYGSLKCFHQQQVEQWLQRYPSAQAMTSIFNISSTLYSSCRTTAFTLGTGYNVVCRACDTIFEQCNEELLFVTCFWAASPSLTRLSNLLLQLSRKAQVNGKRIRVLIGLSSRSLIQKLFHTASPDGYTYKPSQWRSKLGLPSKESIPGIDLSVKSIFIQPFSVMHPKFVVIDRKMCLLPSCNVSWEDWFEGSISLDGPLVEKFVRFWEEFWAENARESNTAVTGDSRGNRLHEHVDGASSSHSGGHSTEIDLSSLSHSSLPWTVALAHAVPALFLPSQYHRNPSFRPFPFQRSPQAPKTPLNEYSLHLMNNACRKILIQSPNVTSPPVISALCAASSRGVSVRIITNKNLMTLEQLMTAGTTTPRSINKLITSLLRAKKSGVKNCLSFEYFDESVASLGFKPANRTNDEDPQQLDEEEGCEPHSIPVKSHLKLMVVDDEVVLLGSGNMDRASWFTSQELGIAFFSEDLAKTISDMVFKANEQLAGHGTQWKSGPHL